MTDKSTSDDKTGLGKIHVAPTAIASIASQAVLKSYGVMGMASRNVVNDIADALTRDPNHGIDVNLDENQVTIDVYVILAYGTRISSVANSIINAVRFEVEKAVGVPVEQVNVYVQGLLMGEVE
jgi:uncharacterized alkaline shock family protein YloU